MSSNIASFLVLFGFFLQSAFACCHHLNCNSSSVNFTFDADGNVMNANSKNSTSTYTSCLIPRRGEHFLGNKCTCTGICYNHTNTVITALYKCNLCETKKRRWARVKDGDSNRILCSKTESNDTVLISLDNKIAEKVPFFNCNAIDFLPESKNRTNFTKFYEDVKEAIVYSM